MPVRRKLPKTILRGCACLAAMTASQVMSASADVEISGKPTENMSCSGGVCTPTAKKAALNVNDLAEMLASGDTTIKSTSQNPDIEIDAAVSWESASRLTLDSFHAIAFNKSVGVAGSGALTITTNDGGTNGDFRFFKNSHVKYSNVNGSLVINGNSYALAKSMAQIKRLIHRGHSGYHPYIALASNIDAVKYNGGVLSVAPDVLEGLGNTISNLAISNSEDRSDVGLFADVDVVRDLGLVNVNVVGFGQDQRVGAIAGEVGGAVLNCFVTGNVSGNGPQSFAGAITGANNGTISSSHSQATIAGETGAIAVGGLVGINAAGEQGQWNGLIADSYSQGTVSGEDSTMVGGLVGYNYGGSISNSYATGAATGGGNSFIGGLIGSNSVSDSSSPTISASYSLSAVSGGDDAMLGGLIGEDFAQSGNSNDYWDLDTSGIINPAQGAGNIQNDPGITGLSGAQLKSGLPAGFDKRIWKEKTGIGNGYPYLIDNSPPKSK